MADLSNFISTQPSDDSTVAPSADFVREQARLWDEGLRQSLELPDGVLKEGAAPMIVGIGTAGGSSVASNPGGHDLHGRLLMTSDTSRLFFYRTQNTSADFGSNVTHLIGTHRFIEHSDYAASIDSLRACQSGSSRIIDDSHGGADGALGSYSFNFSHNGVAAPAFEFKRSPPNVMLSVQETTADTNYVPRVSLVTEGGFIAVFHPVTKNYANSIATVHWVAYGYRDTVL